MLKVENTVILSEKEYTRMIDLISNEFGKTEEKVLEWVNDDFDYCWEHDSWFLGERFEF
jgi:hypothetical protein